MNQQEELEARFREAGASGEVPKEDPFPRMILVCVGITIALLFVIMGCLFVDFVILRPQRTVGPPPSAPSTTAPELPPSMPSEAVR